MFTSQCDTARSDIIQASKHVYYLCAILLRDKLRE